MIYNVPLIMPPLEAIILVQTEGAMLRGVVTGHDTKDGKPIFEYQHDHVMPDGTVIKADKWAWLEQLVEMTF